MQKNKNLEINVDEIHFYTGNKGYKKVLGKDSNNNQNIVKNKQLKKQLSKSFLALVFLCLNRVHLQTFSYCKN